MSKRTEQIRITKILLMNDKEKACPMCGEIILAIAKKCKHCYEYLEINDSPDKNTELTNSSTDDIDSKIKSYLSNFPEFDTNYEVYNFIKRYGNVTLKEIKSLCEQYLFVKGKYVKKILDDLIDNGLICIDIRDLNKITYYTNKISQNNKIFIDTPLKFSDSKKIKNSIQIPSMGEIKELTKSSTQGINERIKNSLSGFPEYDANYATYNFIKRHGDVTLNDIISCLSKDYLVIEQDYVVKILSDLIFLGFIHKHDFGSKVFYSINKINQKYNFNTNISNEISNADKKQDKTQKPLPEDNINDIDDLEIRKYLNKKVLPDLPKKIDINNTECDDNDEHEDLSDNTNASLSEKDETTFDIDKFMSDEN